MNNEVAGRADEDARGSLEDIPVVPDVLEHIALAQEMFAEWGERLRGDSSIAGRLEDLRRKTDATFSVMVDVGVVETCRHCDEEEGGSCCGAGIERRYGAVLLLLNLLLGCSLPTSRCVWNGCLFLGPKGCTLKARHVLCVNYLCVKVCERLSHEGRFLLQDVSGEELDATFAVHEAVKRFIER
jgi:hypothetical protein